MRFFTLAESVAFLEWPDVGLTGEDVRARRSDFSTLNVDLDDAGGRQIRLLSDVVVDALAPWEESMLWIDAPLQWNREALHLYYKVRQAYGDVKLIQEAPVHYFLQHEAPDLLTFLQIGLLNGWRLTLRTRQDYGRADVSRAGNIEVANVDRSLLDSLVTRLAAANISSALVPLL